METHNCGVEIVAPHIESFNDFLHYGLKRLISPTGPLKVLKIIDSDIIHIWLKNPNVFFPINQYKSHSHHPLYPKECRITGLTYKGDFTVDICYTINSEKTYSFTKKMGKIPIMIRSNACWLKKATKKQLISLGEEGNEFGGYFLCNGIEKLIRMTISTRRNYVMALRMSSYKKKGINFTDAACLIRCVRSDHMSQLLRTHYLTNGTVLVAFTYSGAEHIIPVGILIKSLGGITDKEIFEQLVSPISGSIKESKNESKNHNSFVSDRVELLLRQTSRSGLLSQNQNLAYLGHKFRKILDFQNNETDINCGIKVLKEAVLFHLDNFEAKLNILFIMLKKLFALVNHQCCEDNPDVLVHHEIMLPGAMLSKMIGEKMKENLDLACYQWKEFQIFPKKAHQDQLSIRKLMEKMSDVGKKVEYFISTGNFISKSGLELYQVSGFTVVADRLNFYRYLSHFRSVHRGAYFSENHTTTVRKLTPESWGFLCPVHTPDGAPCGLLNHLTANCYVARQIINTHKTRKMITLGILDLGVIPSLRLQNSNISDRFLTVQLDGHLLGFIHITRVTALIVEVRRLKAVNLRLYTSYSKTKVPWHLEILYVSYKREETYPGLFLFTQDARMIRPVLQLPSKELEYIGPLEQQFMDIACPDNNNKGSPGLKFTHIEIDACQILSVIASLIPYSDYNQSPRNIYQCQMSKQAIGNPVHNLECRTEHSIFVLDNAQTPVARTQAYIRQNMDEYPNGVNAVVAVIANTAYDMEDAMIINKKSMEMGIARARIYKTEFVQLADKTPLAVCDSNDQKWNNQSNHSPPPLRRKNAYTSPQDLHTTSSTTDCLSHFSQQDRITKTQFRNFDIDGLPYPGSIVHPDGLINPWDPSIKNNKHKKKKSDEISYVDQVTISSMGSKQKSCTKAWIRTRISRAPKVGDKFASRAGQKGVLSRLWDDIDLPFCEQTGLRPDMIINPNAFPSRMTIGMLVEMITSKTGLLEGEFIDASPFQTSNRKNQPYDISSIILENHGFHWNGEETLISGSTGEEQHVDIFIGSVYYQRLRQMVNDKFQVRSTGAINQLTHQPIKGRKFGGGIRFGEMERDSILAHGAAYLLHDRLHLSSDHCTINCCRSCGSVLFLGHGQSTNSSLTHTTKADIHKNTNFDSKCLKKAICHLCNTSKMIDTLAIPYVFKYLAVELSAMNIKLRLEIR